MVLQLKEDCCLGCRCCRDGCPVKVWEMKDGKAVIVQLDACIECGACVDSCPGQCISLD